jgi:hydrogenase maturation protease
MQLSSLINNKICIHSELTTPSGLALVTVGNPFRSDDGIASVVCDAVPAAALANVCRFELGCYTAHIADCLSRHRAAVIVDMMVSDAPIGSYKVFDVSEILRGTKFTSISPGHAFSWLDELRIASLSRDLPPDLIFFGIEGRVVGWVDEFNTELSAAVPRLVDALITVLRNKSEASAPNA